MKWFGGALVVVLLLLQHRLWFSDDGVRELARLERDVAAQAAENEGLAARNARLEAEVRDLKQGMAALEERARSDLGMVAANETFFQVVPRETPASAPADPARTRTAAR
jgi:cell division protein FtsB